jgi:hypothetical protein
LLKANNLNDSCDQAARPNESVRKTVNFYLYNEDIRNSATSFSQVGNGMHAPASRQIKV